MAACAIYDRGPNKPTTRFFYDGQMGFEDDYTVAGIGSNNDVTVTRYALGARGIDGIETQTTGQNASVVYPIYDGHGNMIATLARSGLSFTRQNDREYGVWGDIRLGSGGDQGYVANLGHRRDVESGLTYMRARYYEPGTGRFISQDPAYQGPNLFTYCGNDPINRVDFGGTFFSWILDMIERYSSWKASDFVRQVATKMDDLMLSYGLVVGSLAVIVSTFAGAGLVPLFVGAAPVALAGGIVLAVLMTAVVLLTLHMAMIALELGALLREGYDEATQ